MDVKVIKGIVTYHGVEYKKDEIISGVDKPTATYLLSLEVAEIISKVEADQKEKDSKGPVIKNTDRKNNRGKQAGPNTSI